jgi:hypothetical protein
MIRMLVLPMMTTKMTMTMKTSMMRFNSTHPNVNSQEPMMFDAMVQCIVSIGQIYIVGFATSWKMTVMLNG